MGRRTSGEEKLLKRRESLGMDEVRQILKQGPIEMQHHAARRLINLGISIKEIKELFNHETYGVKLVAAQTLRNHPELSDREKGKWKEMWEKLLVSG